MRNFVLTLFFSAFASVAVADSYLYMAEEDGCYWCERWHDEIASIYPKTAEGKAAPLVRYDLYLDQPPNVTFKSSVRYTPTFILVEDGQEVGRIEGYPGEDFFWALLESMLNEADLLSAGKTES